MNHRRGRRARRRWDHAKLIVAFVVAAGLLITVAAIALNASRETGPPGEARPAGEAGSPDAGQSTNREQGSTVAGIRVAEPSVDLGTVPLDTPIRHAFALENAGTAPVNLGPVQIETLEGC